MISGKVFQAFYSENPRFLPEEVSEIFICDTLGITWSELQQQPAEWVNLYLVYLDGKGKAEKQKSKEIQNRMKAKKP